MSAPLNPNKTKTSTSSSDSPIDGTVSPSSSSPSPTTQEHFPFLRLPAELRETIYTHALGGHIWKMSMSYVDKDTTLARADNSSPHALALLLTNRQIYSEARLLPFAANTFSGRHEGHLREWARSLSPEQRNQVKALQFVRRGYVVESEQGMDVSPSFWMAVPSVGRWGLEGLKRIEVEVTLLNWGGMKDETLAEETKEWVLARLRRAVEVENPGVRLVVWRAA
ncbi:hypothetical protein B5807_04068 [Epicoccum nigrum]|uniref:Uncharacterized protein n=1 Tax=Epicoccum nigrum TaxID=105696 RepID=A0A1Y2M3S3_EPING|nr:hypothetical protein B5807_04068 [Epicoccum nigrum]